MSSTCLSVPIEHLDYKFIQTCSDVKHLEQILRVLRSGQVGVYSHLIDFCEKHLEKLHPRSRELRKENPPNRGDDSINEDLQLWERSVRMKEAMLQQSLEFSDENNLPPMRKPHTLRINSSIEKIEKSCVPRSYRDWDRSLSLASSATVFNNRAQTQIKLKHWREALSDCESVLRLEPENIKALLRRSTVLSHLGQMLEAQETLRRVLEIEPHNTTAQELLKKTKCETGRRILIEEVEEVQEVAEEVLREPLELSGMEPLEILTKSLLSQTHLKEEKRRRSVRILEVEDEDDDDDDSPVVTR
ncbi:hypothetical protein DNTS_021034 [Danionella cerebrum]|uniref:Uncharacterized protein n=1 Tax=Danionella cerebrum TaxID=2873325 RepID=A0A553MU13_9TELE|nr:hypothetical protein DNTS_021034 [Danionella translucida]